jgi:hypothetical protein
MSLPTASERDSIEALHAFHDELLPETVANALETSFFREHWRGCEVRNVSRETLSKLPTVGKEHIRAAGEVAQNRTGVICNDVFTTGTTGNPLITVRSDREQKFIRDFFSRQLHDRPSQRLYGGWSSRIPIMAILSIYPPSCITIESAFMMLQASIMDERLFFDGTMTQMWKTVVRS